MLIKAQPPELKLHEEAFIKVRGKVLNALGYCVYKGKIEMFMQLLSFGCSLSEMDRQLQYQGLTALNIICANNYLDFLIKYLPIFLRAHKIENLHNETLDFCNTFQVVNEFAIHAACKRGCISVIHYIYNYFQNYDSVPPCLDVHSLNEQGENSALVACRFGQFNILKILYEKCAVKVDILNRDHENAYLITVCGCKGKEDRVALDILNYLYYKVKIDICYMYEELLLAADDLMVVWCIEQKLSEKGITTKKEEVENMEIAESADRTERLDDEKNETKYESSASIISRISDFPVEMHRSSILEYNEMLKKF